ncbi:LPS assembly lipoprotein LptE [Paraferrimonas sp. SM1919]|uniref:LPS-assembly lipoprotein LptE n=1 Tax=Paraferrimonas sp. SM1919 TaxID=2662263 RepID=UPI0013D0E442|nr:LPS assembly lipoprotein LptE [Paraferrimonas sp. SM1919]
MVLKFKSLLTAILALSLMLSAGCGFRFQGSHQIPDNLKQLSLGTQDKYSELTRLVGEQLRLYSVKVVERDPERVAHLQLVHDELSRATLSLFPDGKVAEYELIYLVDYTIKLPNREAQSYQVEIRRDYLDDPRTALGKSREMEMLLKEMRIKATSRIIQSLASSQ